MRPKIVILILVVTVGLVALAAVLKGIMERPAGNEAQAPPNTESNKPAPVVAANPASSNAAAITQQLRAAEIAKELEQIRDLATDPAAGPTAMGIIVGKVTHPEVEVRKAAVEALVQMNDTNAIPGMEQAAGLIEDPREKVALLDAIAYLKLPSTMPDTPPADLPAMGEPGSPSDPAVDAAMKARSGKTRGPRRAPRGQAPGQPGIPAVPPAQTQPQMPGSAPQ